MPRVRPHLRPFTVDDALATSEVFNQAIAQTAAAFYTPAQLKAWNPGVSDLDQWAARRAAVWTVVAEVDGQVAGFSDLTSEGVMDMLFVHPEHGSRGVASTLVGAVLDEARRRGLPRVRTRASRAARPVLEHLGFTVERDNTDNRVRGEVVPNTDMHIDLQEPGFDYCD